MVKIDGKLTDATFRVLSESQYHDANGNKVYAFCVEAYILDDSTIEYVSGVIANDMVIKRNAKSTDRIFINLSYNIDERIGDIK